MQQLDFSAWLRVELAKVNIKQTKLAEMAGVGRNTIYKLYYGQRGPSVSMLFYICKALSRHTGDDLKDLMYYAILSHMASK